MKFGANCGTSCRAPAVLRFALLARGFFPPLRFAGLPADFERAVRTADFFRPGWTRAFFDKVKTYCEIYSAIIRGPVTVQEVPRTTSKTWIGRVDMVEPGQ